MWKDIKIPRTEIETLKVHKAILEFGRNPHNADRYDDLLDAFVEAAEDYLNQPPF